MYVIDDAHLRADGVLLALAFGHLIRQLLPPPPRPLHVSRQLSPFEPQALARRLSLQELLGRRLGLLIQLGL